MRIEIHAVRRLKAGPERELAMRYLDRLAKTGPQLGLEFGGVSEHAEGRAANTAQRKREEAQKLSAQLPQGAALIALDEGGRPMDSESFAGMLAAMRDEGRSAAAFLIGGPDGLDQSLLDAAERRIAFGAMTWPHQIVRIMLAEQLYRAVTILSGHPYHRA
ncbi:23S rRNA (pseudouridine(1915)-N(3))-methyltransferase RlmH [Mesorhizobium sp. Z1-4]|uniref:23S rRNA (pseudouridine(1915)-N(3))-methyltransferase RlmH n=1 Tax=Mesorhizobium sp. Z1-4 TaxID=2448478 RepID=UPI000FD9F496|nr:23S rRNA (pseudouridine(1915)-N(3))-methyltransferase RlmH [Mesorhizobium sp. Z1-4]